MTTSFGSALIPSEAVENSADPDPVTIRVRLRKCNLFVLRPVKEAVLHGARLGHVPGCIHLLERG